MNLLEQLAKQSVIDRDEIPQIQEAAEAEGASIESVLEKRGISPSQILSLKEETHQIPTRELGNTKIPYETLKYIPEESAVHYKIVPLGVSEGALEVGIVDPDNLEAYDALNFISSKLGMPYKVFLISEQDFQKVLEMYKGLSGEVGDALSALNAEIGESIEAATAEAGQGKKGEGAKAVEGQDSEKDAQPISEHVEEDAPVTKIVATILRYAVGGGASDVHIEHMGDNIRVRFRVDGLLNTSLVLPAKVHSTVVARIKILSSMRIDEKRKPQDGRFSATIEGRKVDFRVSTFPAYYGEKVVMRILDKERGVHSIEGVGLTKDNLAKVRDAIRQPYGMILVSGPTGSGKSTTLYNLLGELDRESKNVVSLEDPIEYNIEGVSQSEVRPEIGYTFANGLRTTLRQDPDIIMVGEIRDKETAQLAIQAALTGHLVLSTIHTNTAVGIIPRLIDMGIDPYLIAPTLILGIAQRLVRTLCPDTGKPKPIEGAIQEMYERQFADLPEEYRTKLPTFDTIYEKESTPDCPNGTRGRTGVFEILEISSEIEDIILNNPVSPAIYKAARENGMLSMKEDAMIKTLHGEIPFEEVNTLGGALLGEQESV